MEKGLSSIRGGRLKVAVVAMVCVLAIVALPAIAFGADAPVAGSTVTNSTVKVVYDAGVALRATGASIKINGTAYYTAVSGTTAYAFASLTDGAKAVTASARDLSNALVSSPGWSFTVSVAPKFGAVYPGNGQSFTAAQTTAWFKATDNTGITVSSATVNGVAATVAYNSGAGRYDVSGFSAALPYNTIVATIQDAAGNTSTKTWGFMVTSGTSAAACMKCHSGASVLLGSGFKASGHNTTENGVIGGKSKFDGSQGVTLKWTALEAFTISTKKNAASLGGSGFAPGASFTLGQTGTVTTPWDLPTKSVFWAVGDAGMPADAPTDLSWTKVITCEDCHTAFNATGPHGASANFGLDADYPGEYSRAVLTKKVTSGDAFNGSTNPAESPSGIAMLATLNPPAADQNPQRSYLNGTSGSAAVICAKCHKLMTVWNAQPGYSGDNNTTAGFSNKMWNVVTGANTAHNSHHQDASDNSGQCVNCHIAVPHGWKAPRLLVDAEEGEELSPDAFLWEDIDGSGPGVLNQKVFEGMNTLAGLNAHPLVPADGSLVYSSGDGSTPTGTSVSNVTLAGTTLWDESQCSACGDHYGEDQKFYQDDSNTFTSGDASGRGKSDTAVPARITF